jgi:N,N'-diacetylbacillosaminyl-diphospho-undecaprenol alpha-1,3-N-acetylgalactosaminyltransferase
MVPLSWLHDTNKHGFIKWIGRIRFEDVLSLLDNSDVFVLPTYYKEGIPRSLIEAAAKGKPIITTNTPGCREVVENGVNGFLIPIKDFDTLVDRMLAFLKEPSLVKKMGRASRKKAEYLFDQKKILEQTNMVYVGAIGTHNS